MARPDLCILLPPSEGKSAGGTERWDPSIGPFGDLERQRRKAARAIAGAMSWDEATRSKRLGVKGDALERATRANRRLTRRPRALPAAERFTGVVHDHLDLRGLPVRARRDTNRRVVFFSALGGVLAPDDPVPDHRAKMSLAVEPLGKLSTWWRPHLTAAVAGHLAGRVVVDLLPNEHAAALTPDPGAWAGWLRARFDRELPDGSRKVVGHEAKAGKGRFARHLLLAGSADDAAIGAFTTDDGWSVDDIVEPATDVEPRTVVVVRRDPDEQTLTTPDPAPGADPPQGRQT